MRGKGDDLCDGSEVKSANFLDSMDKKGAVAPRWNFTAVTKAIMERFLEYPSVYLLSMDLNSNNKFRTRIWKVNVQKHETLKERYIEWMNKLGYRKFSNNNEESVNFQLFPPHSGTEETFARHRNFSKDIHQRNRLLCFTQHDHTGHAGFKICPLFKVGSYFYLCIR